MAKPKKYADLTATIRQTFCDGQEWTLDMMARHLISARLIDKNECRIRAQNAAQRDNGGKLPATPVDELMRSFLRKELSSRLHAMRRANADEVSRTRKGGEIVFVVRNALKFGRRMTDNPVTDPDAMLTRPTGSVTGLSSLAVLAAVVKLKGRTTLDRIIKTLENVFRPDDELLAWYRKDASRAKRSPGEAKLPRKAVIRKAKQTAVRSFLLDLEQTERVVVETVVTVTLTRRADGRTATVPAPNGG